MSVNYVCHRVTEIMKQQILVGWASLKVTQTNNLLCRAAEDD